MEYYIKVLKLWSIWLLCGFFLFSINGVTASPMFFYIIEGSICLIIEVVGKAIFRKGSTHTEGYLRQPVFWMLQSFIEKINFIGEDGFHIRCHIRNDDGKLISTDSGWIICGTECLYQQLCHFFQNCIPHLMSIAVIDELEFVYIDNEQCQRVLFYLQNLSDLLEGTTVHNSCERIVFCLMAQQHFIGSVNFVDIVIGKG